MSFDPEYHNEAVAKKVAYEFHMFDFLGKAILDIGEIDDSYIPGEYIFPDSGSGDPWGDDEGAWAMLEAFLLHTRCLYEFFTATRPNKDNIIPSHFVDNWVPADPNAFAYLDRDNIKRLHKALAHIAKERIEFSGGWKVYAIRKEIGDLIQSFREQLPDEQQEWFRYRS
jgi:hypothetical protein